MPVTLTPAVAAPPLPRAAEPPSLPHPWLAWLAFVGLLAVEYGFFVFSCQREVTWYVPTGFDQCVFLSASYDTYEMMRSQGILEGAWAGLDISLAAGSLSHVAIGFLFMVVGPSRLAAMSLNFALFAALQAGLVATLAWHTRRWSAAGIGLGLLLAAVTPFGVGAIGLGGIFDCRLDFGAYCLFGLLTCAMVRSHFLACRRWALVVGLTAATMVLYRHITAVYLAGILGVFSLLMLARLVRGRHDPLLRRLAWRQISGWLLVAAMLATLVPPVLWQKRETLWQYYVVGHLLSEEKAMRQAEFGIRTTLEGYLYYSNSAAKHAGTTLVRLAPVCLAAGIGLWLWRRRGAAETAGLPRYDRTAGLLFFGACLVVPYGVLTWNTSKSPVVGNILLVPLGWLMLLPILAVARRQQPGTWAVRALGILAVAALACGVGTQTTQYCHRQIWSRLRPDANEVLALHESIIARSLAMQLRGPMISTDFVFDCLIANATSVWAYERHGLQLPCHQIVGVAPMLANEDEIMANVQSSDFVVVCSDDPVRANDIYPFNKCMRDLRPRLRAYCEREMQWVQSFQLIGTTVHLYARPQAPRS